MKRIEYIDAMRGLAMLLVVIGHFFTWTLANNNANIFCSIINAQLQIPLFFMISGFFASRLRAKSFWRTLYGKFHRLVIPAILMLALFCWLKHLDFQSALWKLYKEGYWFTLVLFGYIIIYMSTDVVAKKIGMNNRKTMAFHCIVALAVSYSALFAASRTTQYPILHLFSYSEYFNYPFFVIGSLLFLNRTTALNSLSNNMLMGGVIFFYIFGQIFLSMYGADCLQYGAGITVLAVKFAALLIILRLFDLFPALSVASRYGRFLSLVGRRTIDVYFIHYFLIPIDLGSFTNALHSVDAPFWIYLLAIGVSIPLVIASLGIGELLRLSPLTSRLLLGEIPSIIKAKSRMKTETAKNEH